MDYRDTPEEAQFRAALREWLQQNVAEWNVGASTSAGAGSDKEWHRRLYEAGYVGMSWPVEYGGRGLSPLYEAILNDELARADAPPYSAANHIGRAIWTHGTDEQQRRFLTPTLQGDISWCQGFSEPEAGSDIASLRTHASLDGDQWIINGQKLWGMHPGTDWCFLLARTEPELPRHKGISALFVPMDSPGLTCRSIQMSSWEHTVGEAFFDDVRVPADHILGTRGDGWRIAMTTFAYERGAGDVGSFTKYQKMLGRLEKLAAERGRLSEPELRRQLSLAYTLGEALRLNIVEELSKRVAGRPPGSEGSVGKLLWSDAEQTIGHIAMDLLGPDAVLGLAPDWLADYLYSRAASVYGGTSQIQKNLLAQRVLGLPR